MRRTTRDQILHNIIVFYTHLDLIVMAGRPHRCTRLAYTIQYSVSSSSAWCPRVYRTQLFSSPDSRRRVLQQVRYCHILSSFDVRRSFCLKPRWVPILYPHDIVRECVVRYFRFTPKTPLSQSFICKPVDCHSPCTKTASCNIDWHATANLRTRLVPAQYHFRRSRTITELI